jgi:hypothetical protein
VLAELDWPLERAVRDAVIATVSAMHSIRSVLRACVRFYAVQLRGNAGGKVEA